MPWYVFTLLSTFAGSFERILDKRLLTGRRSPDPLLASFYRNAAFFMIVSAFAFISRGRISLLFNIPLIVWALLHVGTALAYDYFLRTTEIVRYNSLSFAFSLLILLFDKLIFGVSLAPHEIVGLLVLGFGGCVISVDARSLRPALAAKQWVLLIIASVISGAEYFLFKYYSRTIQIDVPSFYVSVWLIVVLYLLIILLVKRRVPTIASLRQQKSFLAGTVLSKSIDAIAGLLSLYAVTLTTISNVYVLESLTPLSTFATAILLTKSFRWKLGESIDRHNLIYKACGVTLIAIGSMLFY